MRERRGGAGRPPERKPGAGSDGEGANGDRKRKRRVERSGCETQAGQCLCGTLLGMERRESRGLFGCCSQRVGLSGKGSV